MSDLLPKLKPLFVTFLASGCWTDAYALGLLSLKENGDPMNAADWTKSSTPVFTTQAQNGAFGRGPNGFFKSRDGKEDWIIYHANSLPGEGCRNERNPRIQKLEYRRHTKFRSAFANRFINKKTIR